MPRGFKSKKAMAGKQNIEARWHKPHKTESAPAVMPLVAPLGALPSVPPLVPMTPGLAPMAPGLAPMPPGDSSYSFMFPMMMMMGGRRRRSNSFGSNPMLTSCIQTCQANPGCGPPPAADAGGGGGGGGEEKLATPPEG